MKFSYVKSLNKKLQFYIIKNIFLTLINAFKRSLNYNKKCNFGGSKKIITCRKFQSKVMQCHNRQLEN